MYLSTHSIRSGMAAAAALALIVACNDSPSEPRAGAPGVAFTTTGEKGPPSFEKGKVHSAQVRGDDGVMVSGTALSSTRVNEGTYRLTFEPPIGGCGATANTGAFPGHSGAVVRISTFVSVGLGPNGVDVDDESVLVRLFDSADGSAEDTSFTLTMICP